MGSTFEYKIIDITALTVADQDALFRTLGLSKWELVIVYTKFVSTTQAFAVAYFKRPVIGV